MEDQKQSLRRSIQYVKQEIIAMMMVQSSRWQLTLAPLNPNWNASTACRLLSMISERQKIRDRGWDIF